MGSVVSGVPHGSQYWLGLLYLLVYTDQPGDHMNIEQTLLIDYRAPEKYTEGYFMK